MDYQKLLNTKNIQTITEKTGISFDFIDIENHEVHFMIGNYKMKLKPSKNHNILYLFYKKEDEKERKLYFYQRNIMFGKNTHKEDIDFFINKFVFLKIYDFFYHKINEKYNFDPTIKIDNSYNHNTIFSDISFLEHNKKIFSIKYEPVYNPGYTSNECFLHLSFQHNKVCLKKKLYFDEIDFNFYFEKIVLPVIETKIKIAKLQHDLSEKLKPIESLVNSKNFSRIVKTNNLDVTLSELE